MAKDDHILCDVQTAFGHYQVVDTTYHGVPARVLFTGDQIAAQSAVPREATDKMMFDYNQRFLELAVGLNPERILVIGGGVYTLPMKVLAVVPGAVIDVVEIDAELDELAVKFFGLQPDDRLRIIHADGRDYLARNQLQYDLIIIDAFMGVEIPKSLTDVEVAGWLKRNLAPGGVVAMNIIGTYYGRRAAPLRDCIASFEAAFPYVEVFPADSTYSLWTSQNLILTGRQQADVEPAAYMRFGVLPRLTLPGR